MTAFVYDGKEVDIGHESAIYMDSMPLNIFQT